MCGSWRRLPSISRRSCEAKYCPRSWVRRSAVICLGLWCCCCCCVIHEKGNSRPLRFDHDDVGEEGVQGEEEERLSRRLDLNRILSRSSGIPSLHFDNCDIYIEPLYYKGDTNFVNFSDQLSPRLNQYLSPTHNMQQINKRGKRVNNPYIQALLIFNTYVGAICSLSHIFWRGNAGSNKSEYWKVKRSFPTSWKRQRWWLLPEGMV